jgi:dephospho-CoA kinase
MKLYGLTGGMGMGKSTAAGLLAKRGVPMVDTDVIAHQLTGPAEPALEEIQKRFGREIIGADGRLRREELARLIFDDAAARKDLENILHPRIRAVWQSTAERWQAEGKACGVVVIPLLYETNVAASFDAVVCVACTGATQRQRLQARGWDERQINERNRAQWPVAKKMELANYVIWTEGNLEILSVQLDRIVP